MRKNYVRLATCLITSTLTIGTVSVSATTPGAGVTVYTTNIITSTTIPAAGVLAELSDSMLNGEAEATTVKATEAEVVKSEFDDIAIAKVDDYVYVRAEANSDSDYVGKLYSNNAATVEEAVDGWYKIKSGKVEGYVSADFVVVGDEALIAKASSRRAKVETNSLRVRSEADENADVVTYVGIGDDLKVQSESNDGWVEVKTDEGTGYVSSDYVEVYTKYSYGETKEAEDARIAAEEAEAERQAAAEAAEREAARRESENNNSSSSSSSSQTTKKETTKRTEKNTSSTKKESSEKKKSEKNYKKPSGSNGQAVANYACQFIGNPYVYGGTSLTKGADCSGFVMSVYKAFGVNLPHSSSAMRSVGRGVSQSDMQPGDIVCYSGHVGIYVGGGTIVNASTRKTGIKYTRVHYRKILAVRRIF